ncbi:aminoglycoside 6-adenylyltransferase [Psychrobacillus sp. FSL H8-0484]|uniref:aminoglycoside 6-adenylyltransferase n=1 Tax=Psychrobacillus sp. FSL H8-0484 TaxID=2921390 RepID=UPI0030F60019
MNDYKEMMNRVRLWGEQEDDIRSIFVVGSMARSDKPADEWSDLDLAIVSSDVDKWLHSEEWISQFGNPQVSFLEESPVGSLMERRVMFAGGSIVDFNFLKLEMAKPFLRSDAVREVIARGVKVLLDKDQLTEVFHYSTSETKRIDELKFSEFKNDVNDFWFHTVFIAKKLRRGELLVAKSCCDGYLKRLLLKNVKLQSKMNKSNNQQNWHDVRFFEDWADKDVLQDFDKIYGTYDEESVWKALFQTMELYRKVAQKVANELNYTYPEVADQSSSALVLDYFNGRTNTVMNK